MSASKVDRDWNHLYPAFRDKLQQVLDDVAEVTGEVWGMVEGYRSPERQLYLYAQGRTRAGKIVTWMKTPKWHGTGLAADVAPSKTGYRAPMAWWQRLREIYQRYGLDNPAWGKGDLGHIQLSDSALRAKAQAWVRAGFPRGAAAVRTTGVAFHVNNELIPDALADLVDGRVYVALRPVADALDWTIALVRGGQAMLLSDDREMQIPLLVRPIDGRAVGFAAVRDLAPFLGGIHADSPVRNVWVASA